MLWLEQLFKCLSRLHDLLCGFSYIVLSFHTFVMILLMFDNVHILLAKPCLEYFNVQHYRCIEMGVIIDHKIYYRALFSVLCYSRTYFEKPPQLTIKLWSLKADGVW